MRNKINSFLKDYPLEIKILIIAAFGGIIFAIFTGIANVFLNLGTILILTSVGTAIVGLITFYFAVVKKTYIISAYFGILSLMIGLYPLLWFANGGSRGPMFFFMIFNAVFCSILLAYLNYKVVLVVQLLIVYGLLAYEYLNPGQIVPYSNDLTRALDIGFSFTIVFLVTFYIVVRIMNQYTKAIKELEDVKKELLDINEKLVIVSETDELTGIHNRRHIMSLLKRLIFLNEADLTLIMIDIDYFKQINDTYGHNVGDEVIKKVSKMLADNIRSTDTIGRIGGEEFLVVMPGMTKELAFEKAEFLRTSIGSITWSDKTMNVTISGGVYSRDESDTLDDMLEHVDRLLYSAKKQGKNLIYI